MDSKVPTVNKDMCSKTARRPKKENCDIFDKVQIGIFSYFVQYLIQHCFIRLPSDYTVSKEAGIEPETDATIFVFDADPGGKNSDPGWINSDPGKTFRFRNTENKQVNSRMMLLPG